MKTIFLTLVMLLGIARLNATVLTLDGDLTWDITEPRCTFELDGKLQNNTAFGSGTLKLVLWATPNTFPSPGYIVGEYTLGAIGSGFQFSNFSVRTTSKIPAISGSYHFTIAVAEYTGSGWRNVLAVPTGKKSLQAGNFVGQKKWAFPTAAITAPPVSLKRGNVLRLTLKATDEMNLFPTAFQDVVTLDIRTLTKLDSKNPPKKTPAIYTYSVKKNRFNKKKVNSGHLFADFAAAAKDKDESNVTYTLFFQGATSGTYKSLETNTSGSETTWGTFKFQ